MFCTRCGNPVDYGARACGTCGAPRYTLPSAPPVAQASQALRVERGKTAALVVYILMALPGLLPLALGGLYPLFGFALAMLLSGAALFFTGGTFLLPIVAMIAAYVERSVVAGTWLESHFTWAIRTFWLSILWSVIISVVLALLLLGAFGAATSSTPDVAGALVAAGSSYFAALVAWVVLSIWYLYRMVRGLIYLANLRPMYL